MRNMKMQLIYEIRKCLIANIKAGRGCGDRFLQLFCSTAALPLPDFYKSVASLGVGMGGFPHMSNIVQPPEPIDL